MGAPARPCGCAIMSALAWKTASFLELRTIGLDAGLVDVKVCAVDEVWSGLKFVRRVRDR